MGMFVLQDGKLYFLLGDNGLVGVDVYSDHTNILTDINSTLCNEYSILTREEVVSKFQIANTPYIFPQEIKEKVVVNEPIKEEVVKNEPVTIVQKPIRKSKGK